MKTITNDEQAVELWENEVIDVLDLFREPNRVAMEISHNIVWFYTKDGTTHPITRTEIKHLLRAMEFLEK